MLCTADALLFFGQEIKHLVSLLIQLQVVEIGKAFQWVGNQEFPVALEMGCGPVKEVDHKIGLMVRVVRKLKRRVELLHERQV
jgi:hypothetical protein